MTKTKTIMFQGTGSDVGKSLLVAGLCRLFARRGLRVSPFKSQNMSNNAAVSDDGGEIGRAQWLQCLASGVAPSVHHNPVLLKPQSDKTSQIILQGKVHATMAAKDYQNYRKSLLPQVLESYNIIKANSDIVLVEGAGSPAEINLREGDIANMGFARAINCPVVLIGDIERGGVIASLVGTHSVLAEADRAMIKAFIVNKFRGDLSIFERGAKEIEARTAWKNLGLVPHFAELAKLPQEDSLFLSTPHPSPLPQGERGLRVVALQTPHIANFDDLDPLINDPAVRFSWVRAGEVIPVDANLVILAGSKSTISDLAFIKTQGWDIDLHAHKRRGGRIIGICGGYQMLGKKLSDPYGAESVEQSVQGLGFLEVETVFAKEKTVRKWQGSIFDIAVDGYEIHLGETILACHTHADGYLKIPAFAGMTISTDGLVWGTYIHGLFANDEFRQKVICHNNGTNYNYRNHIEKILDSWADILEQSVNLQHICKIY